NFQHIRSSTTTDCAMSTTRAPDGVRTVDAAHARAKSPSRARDGVKIVSSAPSCASVHATGAGSTVLTPPCASSRHGAGSTALNAHDGAESTVLTLPCARREDMARPCAGWLGAYCVLRLSRGQDTNMRKTECEAPSCACLRHILNVSAGR